MSNEVNNAKISKIKKAAGVTATVLKVIKIIVCVGAIISFIAGLCCFTQMGKTDIWDKLAEHNIYPPVNYENYHADGFAFIDAFDIENPILYVALNCMAAAVCCVIAMIFINIVRRTFVRIETSDTPFTPECLKDIRISAILVTILVAMESIGNAAIVALTFWCVYCIFDYGIELQKDVDETL